MAESLPVGLSESVDRLLAPATREEQISYAVRETLARQAQQEAHALASGDRLRVDASHTSSGDDGRRLSLPDIYQNGLSHSSLADDIETHIGKHSDLLSVSDPANDVLSGGRQDHSMHGTNESDFLRSSK